MTISASLIESLKSNLSLLKPPIKMTITQWSDKYRYLSVESSAEPGKYYSDRAPFQCGIMNSCNIKGVDDITIMTSAQVGKTTFLENIIAYYIDQDPCPILLVQPTVEIAEDFSKRRLAPMIRDTPRLSLKVMDSKSKISGNTLSHKNFPGGSLALTGSNSPAGLASKPIRVVLFDEVSRFSESAGTEGDPVSLGEKRTKTFPNRKKIKVSTPGIKGICRINSDFVKGDQRRYFVPCPFCQEYQVLQFSNLKYTGKDPSTAKFECEYCEKLIDHKFKMKMIQKGEWRKTKEADSKNRVSFHIWEAYSPWVTWEEIIQTHLDSLEDPELRKTFINTSLGEVWEDSQGEEINLEEFEQRRQEISLENIPGEVMVLTAGVDTQPDRLEVQIHGYGKGEECYVLDQIVLYGSPELEATWDQLDEVINKTYENVHGNLKIMQTFIDTGGANTEAVYSYVARKKSLRIRGIKGANTLNAPLIGKGQARRKGKKRNDIKLLLLGVDTAKESLFERIKHVKESGPKYIHFASHLENEFFDQLTAERLIHVKQKGVYVRKWKKIRDRNEALDCFIYAFVAMKFLNPAWTKIYNRRHKVQDKAPAKKSRTRRQTSGFKMNA